jgi:putative SOS response-associated peptidase YedK
MPVILEQKDWSRWLDPSAEDVGELNGLLAAAPEAELVLYPVSALVNNVRNDGPELIEPA